MTRPLVIIDARLNPGDGGGIETAIAGLAEGMVSRVPKDFDLKFLVLPTWKEWLGVLSREPLLLVEDTTSASGRTSLKWVAVITKLKALLRVSAHLLKLSLPPRWQLPIDEVLETIKPDLVHFPFQKAVACSPPFVFQPHDLQHRHLASLFSRRQRIGRDSRLKVMCRNASRVAVASDWVKADVSSAFRIPPEKICVIKLAPLNTLPSKNYFLMKQLPQDYLLYPAVNWPHKNHRRLLQSIRQLRDEGFDVPLVLTGRVLSEYPHPADIAESLGVGDLVVTLDRVEYDELASVYHGSRAVIVPTLFEASSLPAWEAFAFGRPLLCASVTSLPEQVGNAALLFDPLDVEDIARCIRAVWLDAGLRESLVLAGRLRLRGTSWEKVASEFQDVYRVLLDL